MSKPDITLAAVSGVLFDNLGCDPAMIAPSARICEDLGADSLDEVELIMAFEQEYGIDILDEDAEEVKTVQDIITYLEKRFS